MGSTPRALLFDGYAFPIQNGMALPQAILKYPGLSGAAVDEGYAQRRWEQHEDGLRVRYLVPNMQSTEPVSSDDGVYRALVSELLDRDTQGQSSIRFVQDDNGVLTSYFKPLLQTLSPAAIAEPWVARYKDMRAGHGVYAAGRTTQILEFDTGSQLREFHLQLANHFLHHSANFKTEVNLAPTGGRNRGGWYLGASSDRGSPDYWISTQEGTVILLEFQLARTAFILYGTPDALVVFAIMSRTEIRFSKAIRRVGRAVLLPSTDHPSIAIPEVLTPLALYVAAAFVAFPSDDSLLARHVVKTLVRSREQRQSAGPRPSLTWPSDPVPATQVQSSDHAPSASSGSHGHSNLAIHPSTTTTMTTASTDSPPPFRLSAPGYEGAMRSILIGDDLPMFKWKCVVPPTPITITPRSSGSPPKQQSSSTDSSQSSNGSPDEPPPAMSYPTPVSIANSSDDDGDALPRPTKRMRVDRPTASSAMEVPLGEWIGCGRVADAVSATIQDANEWGIPLPRPTKRMRVDRPTASSAMEVRLEGWMGCGRVADVFSATIQDANEWGIPTRVVAKICTPGYAEDQPALYPQVATAMLETEARMYTKMADLQGTTVPRFYGLWYGIFQDPYPTDLYVMLLEDVGTCIEIESTVMSKDRANQTMAAYKALHAAGIVHNNFDYAHVCTRITRDEWEDAPADAMLVSPSVVIVDFTCAKAAGEEGYDACLQKEKRRIEFQAGTLASG